jgi:UTP--glucose-1-phosphate uridylyltransferase
MIRTAVFPIAGRGSRMQPATNAVPKELLPIYDTPLLQFAIDEARDAGIERFVFVTSHDKPGVEAYVRADHGDLDSLFVNQEAPLGLGHAILTANGAVDNEPFAVILPDDVIFASPPAMAQMCRAYETGFAHHMIAAMEVRPEDTGAYGIFDADPPAPGGEVTVRGLVEKPKPQEAPSTLAAVGRYILAPGIFDTLMTTGRGRGGEIQLTDAIARDLQRKTVTAFRFEGVRYDCGRPDGLLEAANAIRDAREMLVAGPVA